MPDIKTVKDFLNSEQADYASYSTLRAIGSLIDGLKNSSRKIVYTSQAKLNSDTKVETFANFAAGFTEYLHGASSLNGVIVSLAQDYAGTNNIPLLAREGIFGSRFRFDASAPRYIYTNKEKYFDKIFNPEDNKVLIKQSFEGNEIEPRFYVPTLPLLLINGSEGIATGFAQKILPRNPLKVIQCIEEYIKTGKVNESLLTPWFRGFKGKVSVGSNPGQFIIEGCIEKISLSKLRITEIPVSYQLESYINVLDDLVDSKTIKEYEDLSEDDNFLFEVTMDSKTLKLEEDKILELLKLKKPVTENYTCINELNRVEEYTSAKEILLHYMDIKVQYTEQRKHTNIADMQDELEVLKSKYFFVKAILEETILINNRKIQDIELELDNHPNIKRVDDKYDYLLNMKITNLTEDMFLKLKEEIKQKKTKYDEYKETPSIELYIRDIESIKKDRELSKIINDDRNV